MISPLIGIGWLVFWLYWIIAAIRTGTKSSYKSRSGFASWYRVIIFVVAVVAIRLTHSKSFAFGHANLTVHNQILSAIGLIVFILGLGFAVWARIYLSNSWGMPMAERQKPELVMSGPYKYVRHPIYSGILLGIVGTALALDWLWFAAAMITGVYFIFSALQEEKYLAEQFSKTYPAYKRRTKLLIPFVL